MAEDDEEWIAARKEAALRVHKDPILDLIDTRDPDWNLYVQRDIHYLLRAAGKTIRQYCGWHIYPNITETLYDQELGSGGRIILPTLFLTDVLSVKLRFGSPDRLFELSPHEYSWWQNGYIMPNRQPWSGRDWTGYYYEPGPTFLPVTRPGFAHVTICHGYDRVPDDIRQVTFELARWTQEMPIGGNVRMISSPGFRLALNQGMGMNLNPDQKLRLGNYCIGNFK